jgi:hypothetical protein
VTQNTSPQVDFEKLIGMYVMLRDWLDAKKKAYEAEIAPRKEQLAKLNDVLLQALNATGQNTARTDAGTAYKKIWHSATVADKDIFMRHVIGTEDWDLIDWRANKTAVVDCVKENKEPPPGINYSSGYDVGVRRPGKDD